MASRMGIRSPSSSDGKMREIRAAGLENRVSCSKKKSKSGQLTPRRIYVRAPRHLLPTARSFSAAPVALAWRPPRSERRPARRKALKSLHQPRHILATFALRQTKGTDSPVSRRWVRGHSATAIAWNTHVNAQAGSTPSTVSTCEAVNCDTTGRMMASPPPRPAGCALSVNAAKNFRGVDYLPVIRIVLGTSEPSAPRRSVYALLRGV